MKTIQLRVFQKLSNFRFLVNDVKIIIKKEKLKMAYSTEESCYEIIKDRVAEYSQILEKENELKKLWSSINLDDDFYSINGYGQVTDPQGNEIFHIPNVAYKEGWDSEKVRCYCLEKIKTIDEEYDEY